MRSTSSPWNYGMETRPIKLTVARDGGGDERAAGRDLGVSWESISLMDQLMRIPLHPPPLPPAPRLLLLDPRIGPRTEAGTWTTSPGWTGGFRTLIFCNHVAGSCLCVQTSWFSSSPLRDVLLRMTRKPRPHQFIGLMGRRSMGENRLGRTRTLPSRLVLSQSLFIPQQTRRTSPTNVSMKKLL